jgi:hypothetical protein
MKRLSWQIWLGMILLLLSILVYYIHYLVFRDPHHIFIYMFGDLAFVFIEVLLVTLIIHHLLSRMAKKARLKKLNMVIGAFFSEVGSGLLEMLSELDPDTEKLQKEFGTKRESPEEELRQVSQWLSSHKHNLDEAEVDWEGMKVFLVGKRNFLLRLLENGNLLEHESFTDMLWAVFHLTEELESRGSLRSLPDADYRHLRGDIKRVYGQLARQWLDYMEHLNKSYPYLFSLELRTNPFNRSASPIVRES